MFDPFELGAGIAGWRQRLAARCQCGRDEEGEEEFPPSISNTWSMKSGQRMHEPPPLQNIWSNLHGLRTGLDGLPQAAHSGALPGRWHDRGELLGPRCAAIGVSCSRPRQLGTTPDAKQLDAR